MISIASLHIRRVAATRVRQPLIRTPLRMTTRPTANAALPPLISNLSTAPATSPTWPPSWMKTLGQRRSCPRTTRIGSCTEGLLSYRSPRKVGFALKSSFWYVNFLVGLAHLTAPTAGQRGKAHLQARGADFDRLNDLAAGDICVPGNDNHPRCGWRARAPSCARA